MADLSRHFAFEFLEENIQDTSVYASRNELECANEPQSPMMNLKKWIEASQCYHKPLYGDVADYCIFNSSMARTTMD